MSVPVKVFVSYSWSVEETTGVVDELESLCRERDIAIIRDKNTMQHGDMIMDFMNKLTSGDHIITVFSKPYFKSPWCMFELLEIWQKGEIQERTHPVIADDCNLQDLAYRIGIVKYWTTEHEKIKGLLDGVDPSLIGEEYKEANRIRDIAQNVSDLMSFAKGRLTTPLQDLRSRDYSQILGRVKPVETTLSQDANDRNIKEIVVLESGKARRIKQLEEQLELWEDKLNEFKKELSRAEGPDARFSIKSKIKHDINPEIAKINQDYQRLLGDNEVVFTEAESVAIIDQIETTIDERQYLSHKFSCLQSVFF